MSYERTTPKDLVEAINMPQGEDMTRFLLYTQRLWEIENAIERGEFVKFPCKVGDKYFTIEKFCNTDPDKRKTDKEIVYGWDCEEWCVCPDCSLSERRIVEGTFTSLLDIVQKMQDFGRIYFLTREEVTCKLQELNKGKNDIR